MNSREPKKRKSTRREETEFPDADSPRVLLMVVIGAMFVILSVACLALVLLPSSPPTPTPPEDVAAALPPVPEEPPVVKPVPPSIVEVKLQPKEPMVGLECVFVVKGKSENGRPLRFQFRYAQSNAQWQNIEGDRITLRPMQTGKLRLEFVALEDPAPQGGGAPPGIGQQHAVAAGTVDQPLRSGIYSLEWDVAANPWTEWTPLPITNELPTGSMLAFSPGAGLLLSGGGSHPLSLARAGNGTLVSKFAPQIPMLPPAFSEAGDGFGKGRFAGDGDEKPKVSTLAALFPGGVKAKSPWQAADRLPDANSLSSLAYSPGGSYVAGGYKNLVALWRVVDGRQSHTILPPFAGNVICLVFSPDEQLLAGCSSEGELWVWSLKTQDLVYPSGDMLAREGLRQPREKGDFAVRKLAFSSDGTLLACASALGIRILRLPDFEVEWQQNDHKHESVHALAFSRKGHLLACARDKEITLLDITKKALVGRILHSLPVKAPAGDGPPFGRPWGPGPQQPPPKDPDHFEVGNGPTGAPMALAFSPDDRVLATPRTSAEVGLYRVADGLLLHSFAVRADPVRDLSWANSSNLLAVTSANGRIELWLGPKSDTPVVMPEIARVSSGTYQGLLAGQGTTIEVVAPPTETPVQIQFRRGEQPWKDAQDGKFSLEQEKAGALHLEIRAVLGEKEFPASRVALTVEEDLLASWGKVTEYAPDTTAEVTCLAHDPQDKGILSGYADESLRWWSKDGKSHWEKREEKKSAIHSVAIHASGTKAVSCGKDGMVRFWDLNKAGSLARPLKLDKDVGAKVVYFPDGNYRREDAKAKPDAMNQVAVCATQTGAVVLAQTYTQPRVPSLSRSKHLLKGAVVWLAIRNPDNNPLVLTGTSDGKVRARTLYDALGEAVQFGNTLRHFDAANGWVATVGENAQELRLWQQTLSHVATVPTEQTITSIALRRDGLLVVAGTSKGELHWWRARDRVLLRVDRNLGGPVTCLEFNSTGTQLAVVVGAKIQVIGVAAAK